MTGTIVRALASVALLGAWSIPAAAQDVRVGVRWRISDHVAAAVRYDSDRRDPVSGAVVVGHPAYVPFYEVDEYGVYRLRRYRDRYDDRDHDHYYDRYDGRYYDERTLRRLRKLQREHEKLHRKLERKHAKEHRKLEKKLRKERERRHTRRYDH